MIMECTCLVVLRSRYEIDLNLNWAKILGFLTSLVVLLLCNVNFNQLHICTLGFFFLFWSMILVCSKYLCYKNASKVKKIVWWYFTINFFDKVFRSKEALFNFFCAAILVIYLFYFIFLLISSVRTGVYCISFFYFKKIEKFTNFFFWLKHIFF